jgi:hypothetical protein
MFIRLLPDELARVARILAAVCRLRTLPVDDPARDLVRKSARAQKNG